MSRWHREDCRAPAVVLIDLQPTCKSCSAVFSLEAAISSQQCGQRSFEKLPPDEREGQLNLWWPPSVKYINSQQHTQRNNNMSEPSQNQTQEDEKTLLQPGNTSSSTKDIIYGKPLPQSSFRLICMQATTELSEPVHIELETYRHSHCPSYETVSYTWGGEQGDSSPCRPIFIGPYWDVLLQTENCWQMLRYARPTRGIRLLWVDAICINQDNDEERAIQVSMMAQIYSECERTLVYLGPEIVKWHPENLSERKGLHELAGAGQSGNRSQVEDHRKLLESRKYFTRLWIIQEVILSPRLIIPIDNIIYWADRRTDTKLQKTSGETWDWWNHTVPWAKSIGQQELPVQNAAEALLLTTQNQSTDPRDRLFGLLALLGSDKTTSPPLRANYTLSNQHIWIGFLAHSISKDGALWVLNNASGHKAAGPVPSWAPDWNSPAMWSEFCRHVPNETDKREFGQGLAKYNWYEDAFYLSSDDVEVTRHNWQQDISVDAASGALVGVRAMRLFTFVEKPKYRGISSSGRYFIFNVEDNPIFHLVSSERLDEIIQPRKDHLYLLCTGSEIMFLVLREHELTTLKAWDEASYFLSRAPILDARLRRLIASCTSLPVFRRDMFSLNDEDLQGYISDLRKVLSSRLNGEALLVPFSRDRWGLLPLYWMIKGYWCKAIQCSDSAFLKAYLACLPSKYHIRTEQSYVTLTATEGSDATIKEMNDWLTSVFTMWFGNESIWLEDYIEWEWSVDNTRWTKFADWDITVIPRKKSPNKSAFGDYSGDKIAPGTWKFNPIPRSQISGAAAGAVVDHETTITKGDGRVRLRAPTQSILKYSNPREEHHSGHLYSSWICYPLCKIAKGLSVTSLEEIQILLLDTSRDWSNFKAQGRWQFSSNIQLINIF